MKKEKDLFLFYMHECFCMYICVPYICVIAFGGQKRVGPLELELQMVVSYHVGAENQTWVFCKSSKCSQPLSSPQSPSI